MIEPDNNAAVAEGPAIASPGKQLREAREARGMTLPETAMKLHLRMLTALEADDYDQLPSAIYVRGYLRNYARLLGLDAERIVAAYDDSEEEHPELKPPLKAPSQASSSDRPVKAVTYLLTLALVLLLLAWWQSRNVGDDNFMDLDNLQATDNADGEVSSEEGSEEQIQSDSLGYPIKVIRHPDTTFYPLPSKQQPAAADGGTAATDSAVSTDTATTPAELLETMPDMDAEEEAADTDAATTPATAASSSNRAQPDPAASNGQGLRLELTKESWVEVYDAAGKRLYLGLGKPGEVIQVDGRAPLRVLLGYAPGVNVRYNGETINTIDHSRAGVAEFSVGHRGNSE